MSKRTTKKMAATVLNLPSVEPFIIDDSTSLNLSKRWTTYKEGFELYILASGVSQDQQKLALLLHLGGKELCEVYHSVKAENETFSTAIKKLDTYFIPKRNIIFERYMFKQAVQLEEESAPKYVARLRRLAETCDYGNRIEEELRDQFVVTCYSDSLRQRLLKEETLDLKKLLELSIIKEQSAKQAKEMSRLKQKT